jgi:hypothetical protein
MRPRDEVFRRELATAGDASTNASIVVHEPDLTKDKAVGGVTE